jgi:hypothetical protein
VRTSSQQPRPIGINAMNLDSFLAEPAGTLHLYVAFDWGDEIDLDRVPLLVPAELKPLPRRPRTPPSIEFRPLPLRLALGQMELDLPALGKVPASAEATLFDFGAVGVAVHVPFCLPIDRLLGLAAGLASPQVPLQAVRQAVEPLYRKLLPAIADPLFSPLSEEYFVFQLAPCEMTPELLRGPQAAWLAGLVRLEAGPLSTEEVNEALRLRLTYSPSDMFVADWPAALLLDQDCNETLQVIEFANLQLLEYRHIDERLDDNLSAAGRRLERLRRSWLPFWRTQARELRSLGVLKVEANNLFERTVNVLKLVGDPYLARVYRLLAGRFHLEQWEQSIQRKLEVLEATYQTLADQAATYRAELLEWLIIWLIAFEIVMAFVRH